jgi:hypothetical protein
MFLVFNFGYRRPAARGRVQFEWRKMKILFVSPEGLPFSKTGGLADVAEALPRSLVESGHQVAVLLPRYRFLAR